MAVIIEAHLSIFEEAKKELRSVSFNSLEDLKKVAKEFNIPFIFKENEKGGVNWGEYYFFHEGILYCYWKKLKT
jgi:hypothetical protein